MRNSFIEGSSKAIVKASPIEILSYKQNYLKSLSPGRLSSPSQSPMSAKLNIPNLFIFDTKLYTRKRKKRDLGIGIRQAKYCADKFIYLRYENRNRLKLNSL